MPSKVTETVPNSGQTIYTLTYSLRPDGRPDVATFHLHADGSPPLDQDRTLTFHYNNPPDPSCAAPPAVLEWSPVDELMYLGISCCPSAVTEDLVGSTSAGATTQYVYSAGIVSSTTQDWGAYGPGQLTVQSAGGEVLSLSHDYFAGVVSLQYTAHGLQISGTWDARPSYVGDPDPPPIAIGGSVELDASGRRSKVTSGATVIEYVY
jgi:hypothetical protein